MERRDSRSLDLLPLFLGVVLGVGTNLLTSAPDTWWPPVRWVAGYAWAWLPGLLLVVIAGELIRRRLAARVRSWHGGESPYPGLESFAADRSSVFFGRDNEIRQLVNRVVRQGIDPTQRFVPLVGASGTGKSSLIQAGVIPRLGERWTVLGPVLPGTDPFASLAAASGNTAGHLREEAARWRDDGTLPASVTARRQGSRHLLLVIDQWEDLQRLPDDEWQLFLGLLKGALTSDRQLRVLVASRPEALGAHRDDPFFRVRVPLGALDTAHLREVITGPAQAADMAYEDGLVDQMVAEAAVGDALPLLGHLLRRLYEGVDRTRLITFTDYEHAGRVQGAIAAHADEVRATLTPVHSEAAIEAALLRFVSWNGREPVRTTVPVADLDTTGLRVAEEFRAARLLVDVDDGQAFDLAHDALLRQWTWFRDIIHTNEDRLRLAAELTSMAAAWARNRHTDDRLLRGEPLHEALALAAATTLGAEVAEFLAASLARQSRGAEVRATRAAAWARNLHWGNPDLARAIARAAVVEAPSPAALLTYWGLTAVPVSALLLVGHCDRVVEMQWLPGGSHLRTLDRRGIECTWTVSGELINTTRIPVAELGTATYAPDGAMILLHKRESQNTILWSRDDGKKIGSRSSSYSPAFGWNSRGTQFAEWDRYTETEILIWTLADIKAGDGRPRTPVTDAEIANFAWCPDDSLIAYTTATQLVVVDANHTRRRELLISRVTGLSWAPEGDQIALLVDRSTDRNTVPHTHKDTALVVVGVDASAITSRWSRKYTGASDVAWSTDGKHIAVTHWTEKSVQITLVEARGRHRSRRLGDGDATGFVRWHPTGSHLAVTGFVGGFSIWDVADCALAATTDGGALHATVNSDRSRCALTRQTGEHVRIIGIGPQPGEALTLKSRGNVVWSPAGERIALVDREGVTIRSSTTGKVLTTLQGISSSPWHLAWSRDGQHVAIHSHDRWEHERSTLQIWDLDSPEPIVTAPSVGTGVGTAAWSPTSDRIAVFDGDGNLRVLAFPDLTETAVFAESAGSVRYLAWSPDGTRLLVVGTRTIIWSPEDGTCTTVTGHSGELDFAAWEPSNRRLAGAAHQTVWVWDSVTGEALAMVGEPHQVRHLDWYDGAIRTILGDGTWNSYQVPADITDLEELAEEQPLTNEERVRFGLSEH